MHVGNEGKRTVPELGGDPDLVARDARLLQGLADGGLGAVTIQGPRQMRSRDLTEVQNTHTNAPSMCLYPALSAASTAPSCASLSCQVPKPIAGTEAPVLSLKVVMLRTDVCVMRDVVGIKVDVSAVRRVVARASMFIRKKSKMAKWQSANLFTLGDGGWHGHSVATSTPHVGQSDHWTMPRCRHWRGVACHCLEQGKSVCCHQYFRCTRPSC